MLNNIELTDADWINLQECSICTMRFSSTMAWAFPFCKAGIPHERMSSSEQIERQRLLAETPEKATASFVIPAMKLYAPSMLKMTFNESDLPDVMPDIKTITLTRERYKMFKNHYAIFGHFIGNVIGKHDFSMKDLFDFARKAWEIEEAEFDKWIVERD